MKTSKKILITVAGVVIALLVTGLFVLRHDALTLFKNSQAKVNYVEIAVDDFENLVFSGKWTVQIRQSRIQKVEVAAGESSNMKTDIENIQGTLYFKSTTDTTVSNAQMNDIRVKITVPRLQSIKAAGGANIQLNSFQSDSLDITLENSSAFTGDNNKIYYSSFKTSGDVLLEFIDNPND